jgi:hypothetical protein
VWNESPRSGAFINNPAIPDGSSQDEREDKTKGGLEQGPPEN